MLVSVFKFLMIHSSLKNWFLGLFVGMILNVVLFVPFSAADDAEILDRDDLYVTEKPLVDVAAMYHQEMNRIFNDSIKQLVQLLSTNKDLSNPATSKKVLERISVPASVLSKDTETFCAEKKENMKLMRGVRY